MWRSDGTAPWHPVLSLVLPRCCFLPPARHASASLCARSSEALPLHPIPSSSSHFLGRRPSLASTSFLHSTLFFWSLWTSVLVCLYLPPLRSTHLLDVSLLAPALFSPCSHPHQATLSSSPPLRSANTTDEQSHWRLHKPTLRSPLSLLLVPVTTIYEAAFRLDNRPLYFVPSYQHPCSSTHLLTARLQAWFAPCSLDSFKSPPHSASCQEPAQPRFNKHKQRASTSTPLKRLRPADCLSPTISAARSRLSARAHTGIPAYSRALQLSPPDSTFSGPDEPTCFSASLSFLAV